MKVIRIAALRGSRLTQSAEFAIGNDQRHAIVVEPFRAAKPHPEHDKCVIVVFGQLLKRLAEVSVEFVDPVSGLDVAPRHDDRHTDNVRCGFAVNAAASAPTKYAAGPRRDNHIGKGKLRTANEHDAQNNSFH